MILQKKLKKKNLNLIKKNFIEHRSVLSKTLNDKKLLSLINEISDICISSIKNNKKIIFLGNGGSASDSMHLTAELIGRFKKNRAALPAVDLVSNSSSITAIANDYDYKKIFSRQLEAIGVSGDVLFCFTTSGLSINVIDAIKIAQKRQINIVVFTGKKKNYLSKFKGLKIVKVPSKVTARVQEMHILIGHIVCEIIENELF
jgi:D-sedoheptulose 7-phosphate isomerase